jgi:hypothetical protein
VDEKKFRGRWHHIVPIEEMKAGDYVEFNYLGRRSRKVKKVHIGRKISYIQVEPLPQAECMKKKKINHKDVVRVWRRGRLE